MLEKKMVLLAIARERILDAMEKIIMECEITDYIQSSLKDLVVAKITIEKHIRDEQDSEEEEVH